MSSRSPLLVGNIVYTGGRVVRGLYVEVVNRPGVLGRIAGLLGDLGLNIWVVDFGARVNIGEVATGFLVVDATGREEELRRAVERLAEMRDVRRVELVEPQLPGVLVDEYHFPLVDDRGERHILVNPVGIRGIVVGLAEEFGDAAKAFLYHQGREIGEALAEALAENGVRDPRMALRFALLYSAASGRHRGEIAYYRYRGEPGDTIVLRLHDNWECAVAKQHGVRGPASHVERGVYAGLLSRLTGRRAAARETRCVALGDPYCEITVTLR